VQDHQRLAALLLEGHRGDRARPRRLPRWSTRGASTASLRHTCRKTRQARGHRGRRPIGTCLRHEHPPRRTAGSFPSTWAPTNARAARPW
jgi:hypothetical protein